jgi:hypothetical protein
MPLLLLLIDFIFNSYQFPLRHFLVTVLVAAIYIVINQVHSCNDKPVYDAYQCGDILLPLVAVVILAVAHAIGHLVWKLFRGKKLESLIDGTKPNSLLENDLNDSV